MKQKKSYIWILNEQMNTSLDRFYAKVFNLKLQMPESFLSKVAHSVLSALEFMRSKKLMHRDIKPSNILINSTGEIKVCDFGISGITTNSVNHTYIGSQVYMSVSKFHFYALYRIEIELCAFSLLYSVFYFNIFLTFSFNYSHKSLKK